MSFASLRDAEPRTAPLPSRSTASTVAVVHADDDDFYAVHDECSHADVALSEGEVDGCTLECWLHGSRFDLRTGEPPACPPPNPSPSIPVEIRDGDESTSTSSTPEAMESLRPDEHPGDPRPAGLGQAARRR